MLVGISASAARQTATDECDDARSPTRPSTYHLVVDHEACNAVESVPAQVRPARVAPTGTNSPAAASARSSAAASLRARRGNHESSTCTKFYGFMAEVKAKYGKQARVRSCTPAWTFAFSASRSQPQLLRGPLHTRRKSTPHPSAFLRRCRSRAWSTVSRSSCTAVRQRRRCTGGCADALVAATCAPLLNVRRGRRALPQAARGQARRQAAQGLAPEARGRGRQRRAGGRAGSGQPGRPARRQQGRAGPRW
jgi:hypothetical protein